MGNAGDLHLDYRVAEFYGGGMAGTLHIDLTAMAPASPQNMKVAGAMAVPSPRHLPAGEGEVGRAPGATFTVRGQDPQIDLVAVALGFQVEPLLTDLTGAAALSGRGDLNLKLTTAGWGRDALVRGLGGRLILVLRDGSLRGLDLSPVAALAGLRPQTGQSPSFTAFTELSASAPLAQGVLRSDDLVASGPWMRLTGSGTLDLVDGRLDWRLAPILTAPPQGGGIKELEGIPIPVYLGGTLGDPTWRVDVAAVLREVARRRLEDRGGDVIDRLERRTGVKGLDGVLRGLLGR
jgi:AsmA protein